jgi:uncharacterized protein
VRLRSRLLPLLFALPAFGATTAFASDLQCATTRQPAERVICDHAILNNEYDDIYAQQQNLLSAGKVSPQDIAGWKQARNACVDVHCIDSVFAQWKSIAQGAQTRATASAAPPAVAQLPDVPPGSAVPDASAVLPASAPAPDMTTSASAPSDASQVRQGSAAGIAMPQAVDPSAASASSASAPPTTISAASDAGGSRMTGIGPGLPIAIVIVLLIAVGTGIFFMRRMKR